MEKQLNIQTNYQDNHWLNIAEIIAVAGSVGGSIASIFLKEIALASVPLSACVALNLINRKRLLALANTQNVQAIATQSKHNQNDLANICDQMMQIQKSVSEDRDKYEIDYKNISEELKQTNSENKKDFQQLKSQYDELVSKTVKLAQNTTFSSAELYCQNAIGYQRMGEKQKAIDEYTKAIKVDDLYVEAYVGRGILSADVGNRKLAVQDLRKAAKLYFDKGDLDSYRQIKQKTQNIHQLNSGSTVKKQDSEAEAILANSLFS